jgi:hypothetical protein
MGASDAWARGAERTSERQWGNRCENGPNKFPQAHSIVNPHCYDYESLVCLLMCACVTFNFSPLFRAAADRTRIGYAKFISLVWFRRARARECGRRGRRGARQQLVCVACPLTLRAGFTLSGVARTSPTHAMDVEPSQQTSRQQRCRPNSRGILLRREKLMRLTR